ncbi:hypothetical protein D3C85_1251750 [compost metagenome]
MAVAAAGDRQDPPWACRKLLEQFGSPISEFLCLSKENGFASDFGHVEMLVSKEAQLEVWPLVARWLDKTQGIVGEVKRTALERGQGVPPEQ